MSEFERLRRLLLGDADAQLAEQARRLDAVESAHAALPDQLPGLLNQTQRQGGSEALASALARPLGKALAAAVREQRQSIVDALFPVIGPAIRKAIAEALRDFSDSFNRALESSFTARGLRWRLEAWRSGSSYADVVLRHSLNFRIDHLFLIARDSGLVLQRQSATDLPDLDADAIAGMLTAIGDFVRDSVGAGDGDGRREAGLAAATVGEHLLWVLDGPLANLAVFLRGVPTPALRRLLQERLEQWHQSPAVSASGADGAAKLSAGLDVLELQHEVARLGATPDSRPLRRVPLLLIALAVVSASGWYAYRVWAWHQCVDAAVAPLLNWPGLHLDRVDSPRVGELRVHGLLDPIAESPLEKVRAALPASATVELRLDGYVSTDPRILNKRARNVLAPPETVRLVLNGAELQLSGEASAEWIADARLRAGTIAGIERIQSDGLHRSDPPLPSGRAELTQILQQLVSTQIVFVHDLAPVDSTALDQLAADALRASQLAVNLRIGLRLACVGYTDSTGRDAINLRLREQRAEWLCRELGQRGVPSALLGALVGTEAAQSPQVTARAAVLRVVRVDGAPVDE